MYAWAVVLYELVNASAALSLCVCVCVCARLCTVGRQVLMDRDRLLSGRSHAVVLKMCLLMELWQPRSDRRQRLCHRRAARGYRKVIKSS